MALSNIFREPRREITESAVGVVLIGGVGYLWFHVGWRLAEMSFHPENGPQEIPFPGQVVIWMLLLFIGALLAFGLVIFTHFIGEEICDALDRRGLQLRPRERG